jgi:hypothetical protein
MDVRDTTRKNARHIESYLCEALARVSGLLVTATASLKPSYANGIYKALSANDSDPNSSEPTNDRLVFGGDIAEGVTLDTVTLWRKYAAGTGVVVFTVWVRSGMDVAVGPVWIPVKQVTFAGTAADIETSVNVGNRTTFVQATSGVDIAPCTLYVAVA